MLLLRHYVYILYHNVIMMSIFNQNLAKKIGGIYMSTDNLKRYTMRTDKRLLDRLQYISQYNGRTANKQLEQMVKQLISKFEKQNGEITDAMIEEMYANK